MLLQLGDGSVLILALDTGGSAIENPFMRLPFVFINVAMTADGKLAPANRHFVPFGSKHDRALLLELRAKADAVMAGARTVDLMPVNLGPGPVKNRQARLRNRLA